MTSRFGRCRLDLFGWGALLTRIERIHDASCPDSTRSTSILYASDLHLGRPWTARLPGQLLRAATEARPEAILLGGDLVDCPKGLADTTELVRRLSALAPTYAVPGNHDVRAGLAAVRSAVESGGGLWLDQIGSVLLNGQISLHGVPSPRPPDDATTRVLCLHDPADFADPAVAGAFDLVLAGHLHGGQFVLFERRSRLYPGAWINRFTGLRFEGNTGLATLIVSRGAGDTLPTRWNCPREVILCQFG